jgi:serine/threonine protein kinase
MSRRSGARADLRSQAEYRWTARCSVLDNPFAPSVSLANGSRLGPYEILSAIGAGGMGEVYRARDMRLKRDVAIKVLPDTFTTDRSLVARFQREAELLATLNHPNIAHIHGLEESGSAVALVLELVEGATLADRIAQGPVPVSEALSIGRQLAEALDAAHERGIVHRDLKPANIKVTPAGVVKVLDFGLAKATANEIQRPDLSASPTITANATRAGVILGTAAYMSPEQARGIDVDKRADIWAFGCVLYELLTGGRAMSGGTVTDILAAVLTSEPDWSRLPSTTPPRVVALLRRCLTKELRDRQRDIGDARHDLNEPGPDAASSASSQARHGSRSGRAIASALVLAGLAGLGYVAWPRSSQVETWVNPLADATFTRITDFPGTETMASISPDGRFVAFMSDRDGPMHVWLTQIGSGRFTDLTKGVPSMSFANRVRPVGFSGDGTEVWTITLANQARLIPLIGGEPQPFLSGNAIHPSWSPDGASLAYFRAIDGDPIYVADRSGGNAREIFKDEAGIHNHNPVWSPDGQWIYFVHGRPEAERADILRIRPSGGRPETIIDSRAAMNFVAPLDARTLLFVARAEDLAGPWLWSLDVDTRQARRVTTGIEQYLSVAASADGRRIVATVANPIAGLWSLPILDRQADERDMRPFAVPSVRALGPRFGGGTLFYLSSRGAGEGLWRVENSQTSEIWKGADGPLVEPAAVSRDGQRVAIVIRRAGRGHVTVMNANGTDSRDVAPSLDVQGVVDWAPEGSSIVAGAIDADGPGVFLVPLDGSTIKRLTNGIASSPVWSPDGKLIAYSGPNVGGRQPLLGVRPDGTAVPLPAIYTGPPGARGTPRQGYRFLPGGSGLMYIPAQTADLEFWVLNLATNTTKQIAKLAQPDEIRAFDITPDGKQIVFDRLRENADIVLIERR